MAMANCIKLKLPGLDERDVLLTKGNMLLLFLVVLSLFNAMTTNINNAKVTTIATMSKGMKMNFSRDFERGR